MPTTHSGFLQRLPLRLSGLRPSGRGRGMAGDSSGMLGSWSSRAWRERAGSQLPDDPRGHPASHPHALGVVQLCPADPAERGGRRWDQQFLPIPESRVPGEVSQLAPPALPGFPQGTMPWCRGWSRAQVLPKNREGAVAPAWELCGLFGGSRSRAGSKGASRP